MPNFIYKIDGFSKEANYNNTMTVYKLVGNSRPEFVGIDPYINTASFRGYPAVARILIEKILGKSDGEYEVWEV